MLRRGLRSSNLFRSDRSRLLVVSALLALGLALSGCGQVPEIAPTATATLPAATMPAPSTVRPTAGNVTPPAPPSPPPCIDRAAFEADVTVPDGTLFAPGQAFVKTWRLRNSGTCSWTLAYALVFVSGDSLGGPVSAPFPAAVAPGETVDLSLALTAPSGAGTYEGRWQLSNAQGQLFGLGADGTGTLLLRIVVAAPTPEPSTPPTSTPVPPTLTPAPTATPFPGGGWLGEYYSNPTLSGTATLVRRDAAINFDWGSGSPDPSLPADGFSVRWTRTLSFAGGMYRFQATVDDGMRLWVDDALVLDSWFDGGARGVAAYHAVAAGDHALRVEYYERTGVALIQVSWDRLTFPDWMGEYWTNRTLSGDPALVQDEGQIDFNWGAGGPAAGFPVDNFSARWTRSQQFTTAFYRFHVRVDDGARVWLDDRLIIDAWQDGAVREVFTDAMLITGTHSLRVEYYEHSGLAEMHFWWQQLLTPPFPDWMGQYWANMDLSGIPALVRDDVAIDFNWGTGAAGPGLPVDRFSARWSRLVSFTPGSYTFFGQADNGIRFYLDGNLLIDQWASNGRIVYAVTRTLSGTHALTVEYFDNAGPALVKFWWQPPGSTGSPTVPPTPIPRREAPAQS